MIPVEELIYDVDFKLNNIASNKHQGIEIENKILALNDAHISLILTKYGEDNKYKFGLDSVQKRYNDLEGLVEKDKYLPLTEDKNPLKSWSCNLELLNPTYMLGIPGSEYILADKNNCKDNVVVVEEIKHGDIRTVLSNTNTKPSFEYQETPGVISKSRWQVFTDGTFTPKKFFLWYIRYPVKVDYPGYVHFGGKNSILQNSELPYFLKEELTDLAVRNLAMSTENQSAFQYSNLKVQNNE